MSKKKYFNKQDLQKTLDALIEGLNDYAKDFYGDYKNCRISYIGDAISEYADSCTSVYYNDQRKFYNEHTELCENALDAFGYTGETLATLLKECRDLDGLICKAGAIGEYDYIYGELTDNQNELMEAFLLKKLIDNDNIKRVNVDKLNNALIEAHERDSTTDIEDIIDTNLMGARK